MQKGKEEVIALFYNKEYNIPYPFEGYIKAGQKIVDKSHKNLEARKILAKKLKTVDFLKTYSNNNYKLSFYEKDKWDPIYVEIAKNHSERKEKIDERETIMYQKTEELGCDLLAKPIKFLGAKCYHAVGLGKNPITGQEIVFGRSVKHGDPLISYFNKYLVKGITKGFFTTFNNTFDVKDMNGRIEDFTLKNFFLFEKFDEQESAFAFLLKEFLHEQSVKSGRYVGKYVRLNTRKDLHGKITNGDYEHFKRFIEENANHYYNNDGFVLDVGLPPSLIGSPDANIEDLKVMSTSFEGDLPNEVKNSERSKSKKKRNTKKKLIDLKSAGVIYRVKFINSNKAYSGMIGKLDTFGNCIKNYVEYDVFDEKAITDTLVKRMFFNKKLEAAFNKDVPVLSYISVFDNKDPYSVLSAYHNLSVIKDHDNDNGVGARSKNRLRVSNWFPDKTKTLIDKESKINQQFLDAHYDRIYGCGDFFKTIVLENINTTSALKDEILNKIDPELKNETIECILTLKKYEEIVEELNNLRSENEELRKNSEKKSFIGWLKDFFSK